MIEFNDSFSQAAVAEAMCAHSGLAKLISQQLMLPSFAYAHDVEGRRIGGPLVAPNPVLHKTTLFVSPRDMREHLPREINFARFRCACNAAGQPVGVLEQPHVTTPGNGYRTSASPRSTCYEEATITFPLSLT